MQPIKPRHWRWPIALAAVFVPGIATGALTLPHVFIPGTPIRSAEVNANFDAVRQKSDSIEAGLVTVQSSVTTLQGQVGELMPLPARVATLESQVGALQLQVIALQNQLATKLTAGHTSSYVNTDQGILGSASNNLFVATPTAARITTPTTPGTYLLVWYAEYTRTQNGGGNRVFARLRNVTTNSTTAYARHTQGIENLSPAGAFPTDAEFATAGDVLEFSGSITLPIPQGQAAQTYELQYAINNNGNTAAVIRVQRQRLDLVRVF
jgi:hypothetical protein